MSGTSRFIFSQRDEIHALDVRSYTLAMRYTLRTGRQAALDRYTVLPLIPQVSKEFGTWQTTKFLVDAFAARFVTK